MVANGEIMCQFSSIIQAYNGHNFCKSNIYNHIKALQHTMNKGQIANLYKDNIMELSLIYQDNITLGLDELEKYENVLGDYFGDKKR